MTFANVDRFTRFFRCQISEEILYVNIIGIIYLTLNLFLLYLVVKLDNHTCCCFQWHKDTLRTGGFTPLIQLEGLGSATVRSKY